jgi:hypothetical protein
MKPVHPLLWLAEPLQDNPTYVDRSMFGGRAVYYDGRMVLYLTMKAEPWRGVLVPAEREAHAALRAEFPALAPHPVLPKWLYLPESGTDFERDAQKLVTLIRALDPRIGVLPEAARPGKPRRARRPRATGQKRR